MVVPPAPVGDQCESGGRGPDLVFPKRWYLLTGRGEATAKRIVNTSLVVFALSTLAYVLFNFVILTEIGVALNLPWESSRLWN